MEFSVTVRPIEPTPEAARIVESVLDALLATSTERTLALGGRSFLWDVRDWYLNAYEGPLSEQTVEAFRQKKCGTPVYAGVFCDGTQGHPGNVLLASFIWVLRHRASSSEHLVLLKDPDGRSHTHTVRIAELERDLYRIDVER